MYVILVRILVALYLLGFFSYELGQEIDFEIYCNSA